MFVPYEYNASLMHSTLVSYSSSDIRHAILYAHGRRVYYERKWEMGPKSLLRSFDLAALGTNRVHPAFPNRLTKN